MSEIIRALFDLLVNIGAMCAFIVSVQVLSAFIYIVADAADQKNLKDLMFLVNQIVEPIAFFCWMFLVASFFILSHTLENIAFLL